MSVEDKFFPLIAGELGDSTESAEKFQKKLDEFTPTVKVELVPRGEACLCWMFHSHFLFFVASVVECTRDCLRRGV